MGYPSYAPPEERAARMQAALEVAIDWFRLPIDDFQEKYRLDDPEEVVAILERAIAL